MRDRGTRRRPGPRRRRPLTGQLEQPAGLVEVAGVRPSDHVGHAHAARARRPAAAEPVAWPPPRTRRRRRPSPLRAGVASTSQPATRWAADQSGTARQRRPPGERSQPGGPGRVEDPARPVPRAPAEGGGGQVVLDRGGDDRSPPFEQGRHGQPAGLAGLGRADHQHRMAGLGGEQTPVAATRGVPARAPAGTTRPTPRTRSARRSRRSPIGPRQPTGPGRSIGRLPAVEPAGPTGLRRVGPTRPGSPPGERDRARPARRSRPGRRRSKQHQAAAVAGAPGPGKSARADTGQASAGIAGNATAKPNHERPPRRSPRAASAPSQPGRDLAGQPHPPDQADHDRANEGGNQPVMRPGTPTTVRSGPWPHSEPLSHGRVGVDQRRLHPADACSTRNERSATFHSATPRGSRVTRSRSVSVRRSSCRLAPASDGGLAEHHSGLGIRQQTLGQPLLGRSLGAGGAQVGQPVHHRHVGDAHRPRQLERGLQPAGRGQVVQHGPGLVDDHQPLAARPLRPGSPATSR